MVLVLLAGPWGSGWCRMPLGSATSLFLPLSNLEAAVASLQLTAGLISCPPSLQYPSSAFQLDPGQ